jgi:hypothetical protein
VLAVLAALAMIAAGILTNIGTAQPLPGVLRWLQRGSREWVALGACAVVLIVATVVSLLPGETSGTQASPIQARTKPKLQPRYDETSSQYRYPNARQNPGLFQHRLGLL